MTDQHPITPPTELVQQWWEAAMPNNETSVKDQLCTQAAQWGADQQSLPEEDRYLDGFTVASLRAARRPKPPSLKEQAFAAFKNSPVDSDSEMLQLSADAELIIRRALGALPND